MSKINNADTSVVDRIRRAMTVREMTMADLSRATSIPYRSLQNYLSGVNAIPATVAAKVADALEVSADWILLGEAQRFDLEIVAQCLSLAEDVRVLSGHKVSFAEVASMFDGFYEKFYRDRYGRTQASEVDDSEGSGSSSSKRKRSKGGKAKSQKGPQ